MSVCSFTPPSRPRSSILLSSSKNVCTSQHALHLLRREQMLIYVKSLKRITKTQQQRTTPAVFSHVNSCLCCIVWLECGPAGSRPPCCVEQPADRCEWPTLASEPDAPDAEVRKGPVCFAVQPGSRASFVGLECAVRASSSASPHPSTAPTPLTYTRPTLGTLARSHRKLLADFSHIVTCWFVNSDKCNRRRAPRSVDLYASLARHRVQGLFPLSLDCNPVCPP